MGFGQGGRTPILRLPKTTTTVTTHLALLPGASLLLLLLSFSSSSLSVFLPVLADRLCLCFVFACVLSVYVM
ncbi:hypothetical protein Scep_007785 [Stephania cephalantha]|uniref:Transmembrane protein n=1 Tax=Stephania cephalantha TaxID=152367 RepID=A0AAP0KCB6_9MAGN